MNKIYQILFHSDKKTFETFWETIKPIKKIVRRTNSIYIPNNNVSIPFQQVPSDTLFPSCYGKKQQHIILLKSNTIRNEKMIRKQLQLFKEAQIEEPLIIIILMNSHQQSYKELKEIIFDEMKSESCQENQMIKSLSLSHIQQDYDSREDSNDNNSLLHVSFLSTTDLKKRTISFQIIKIPPINEMYQSIGNKIVGVLMKGYFRKEREWTSLSLERRQLILKSIAFLKTRLYCQQQELFRAIGLDGKNEQFQNEFIRQLNDYGLTYSYIYSEFQNVNQPKLNQLRNYLIQPMIYVELAERIASFTSDCQLIDIISIVYDAKGNYLNIMALILRHYISMNDIFVLHNDMIKECGIEDAVENYFQFNQPQNQQQSTLVRLLQHHHKTSQRKSIGSCQSLDTSHHLNHRSTTPTAHQSNSTSRFSFQRKEKRRLLYFQFIKTNDIKELHWMKYHYENEFEFARTVETGFPNKGVSILITGLLLDGSQLISYSESFLILELCQWKQKGYCLLEKDDHSITFRLRTVVSSYESYLTILQTLNRLYHLLEKTVHIRKKYIYCPSCLHQGIDSITYYHVTQLEQAISSLPCQHDVSLIECFPDIIFEQLQHLHPIHNHHQQSLVTSLEEWKELTEGSFSTIYLGYHNNRSIIKKQLHYVPQMDTFQQIIQQFVNEITVGRSCQSQYLVSLIDYSIDTFSLFMEYYDGGTIYSYIDNKQNNPFPHHIQLQLLLDISKGIAILHDHQLIHRDIKSPNMLLKYHPLHCVLSDFGLCAPFNSKERIMIDNPIWLAPEILLDKPFTTHSDIYSFAIVLWEICSFQHPFQSFHFMAALIGEISNGLRPDRFAIKHHQLRELCQQCWDDEPSQRPSISFIIDQLNTIQV